MTTNFLTLSLRANIPCWYPSRVNGHQSLELMQAKLEQSGLISPKPGHPVYLGKLLNCSTAQPQAIVLCTGNIANLDVARRALGVLCAYCDNRSVLRMQGKQTSQCADLLWIWFLKHLYSSGGERFGDPLKNHIQSKHERMVQP